VDSSVRALEVLVTGGRDTTVEAQARKTETPQRSSPEFGGQFASIGYEKHT
jgi:hypothetical protein